MEANPIHHKAVSYYNSMKLEVGESCMMILLSVGEQVQPFSLSQWVFNIWP